MPERTQENTLPESVPLRTFFHFWIAGFFVSLLLLADDNFLGFFPSMIVHEIGHSFFAITAGMPAISFFFGSWVLENQPLLSFVLILLLLEAFSIFYCYQKGYVLLQSWLVLSVLAHGFFLMVPHLALPLAVYGGVAGEFVLPLLLLVFLIEMPRLRGVRAVALFCLSTIAFWRGFLNWWLCNFGQRGIPYPRDGTGGISVFQDPFNALEGVPEGDMDKLIKIYGWSERQIVDSYAALSFLIFAGFCVLWYVVLPKDTREKPV